MGENKIAIMIKDMKLSKKNPACFICDIITKNRDIAD
jgi:hypothetical protein